MAVHILFGLVFVGCGVGTLIFRKQYLEWQKRMLARSSLSPRLKPNPSERFLEVNAVITSILFVGFGLLVVVLAAM
jgi:hypothetical protein